MNPVQNQKPVSLDLEVKEVERRRTPVCGSSSTSPHCTCPVLFTPDPGTKK
jgi:hypothetical protein